MRMSPDQAAWVEAAFGHPAFLALREKAAPSFILDFEPVKVVWANTAATAVLGAVGGTALAGRLQNALRRELADLARALQPGAAPRLQRLRIATAPASSNLTVLCCRRASPKASLVLAVVGPSLVRPDAGGRAAAWDDSLVVPGPEDMDEAIDVRAFEEPEAVPRPVLPVRSFEAELQTLREELGGSSKWRFLWQADGAGLLSQIDNAVLARLGASAIPNTGASFAQCVAGFDPEKAQRLDKAFARRRAWSHETILWPIANGRCAVPLMLGASPQYEADRHFAGFRGFGVLDLDGIRTLESPGEDQALDGRAPSRPCRFWRKRAGPRPSLRREPRMQGMRLQNPCGRLTPRIAPRRRGARPARVPRSMSYGSGLLQGLSPGDSGSPGDTENSDGGFGPGGNGALSSSEHFAFREIARALGARIEGLELPAEVPDDLPPVQALGEVPPQPAVLERADNTGALAGASGPDRDPPAPEAASSVQEPQGMLVAAQVGRSDNADPIDAARLRAVLDAAGDAIATIDEAGRILTLNRQGERWFGHDRRQLVGQSFTLAHAPESRTAAGALLARIATSPGSAAELSRERRRQDPRRHGRCLS